MRVNTTKSLRLASRVKRRYGSWHAVKAASRLENGIYVIEQPPAADQDHSNEPKATPVTA